MVTAKVTLALVQPDSGIEWTVKFSNSFTSAESGIDADTAITNQNSYFVYPVIPSPATFGLTSVGSSYFFRVYFTIFEDPINVYFGSGPAGVGSYLSLKDNDPAANGQFQTTGMDLSIFSDTIAEKVAALNTWRNLAGSGIGNTGVYTLNSDRHTVLYDYNNRWAPLWSKGGNLKVTIG